MAGISQIYADGFARDLIPRSTAPTFLSSTSYAVGDYVYYQGNLYRCTTAHTGTWVASHFTAVTVGSELKAKEAEIADVKTDLSDTRDELIGYTENSFNGSDGIYRDEVVEYTHNGINNGEIIDANNRALSEEITFDSDFMDFAMEADGYMFAVFFFNTSTNQYSLVPWMKGSTRYGRVRVYDNTKRYRVQISSSSGATETMNLDYVASMMHIYKGSFNRNALTDEVVSFFSEQMATYNLQPIPLFCGSVTSSGYASSAGEAVTVPIDVGKDVFIVNLTNSTYRYAVYSIDGNDTFEVLSGGWATGENEYTVTNGKKYIVRVGRANGSTSTLSKAEYDAIVSALSLSHRKTITLVTPVNNLKDKKISVSGDSRTTFEDTQPAGYPSYYPDTDAGLTVRSDMWWQRVIDHFEMEFLANASWSGGLTGIKEGFDALSSMCADGRISALSDGISDPDIIIVYTGVNDWINNVPLGTYDGSGTFPSTYETFADAVAIMINKIQTAYPNADLWVMANSYSNPESTATTAPDMAIPKISTRLLAQYNDKMEELCKKMCVTGYINLEFCGVNHMNIQTYATDYPGSTRIHGLHYNRLGHEKIAKCIISELDKYYNS